MRHLHRRREEDSSLTRRRRRKLPQVVFKRWQDLQTKRYSDGTSKKVLVTNNEVGGAIRDMETNLHISYDGGQTWQKKWSCFPNYLEIYRMAFHPTDPNKWIAGGNHCVHTTSDNGQTWNTQVFRNYNETVINWHYAAYDNENADIVYMAGGYHSEYMKLMCSTNGGTTWNRPYLEPIKTTPTEIVFDMKQYGDKLLVYSQSDVYEISKAELLAHDQGATSAQCVAQTTTGNKTFYDLQGRRLSGKPAKGVYINDGKKYIAQ